MKYYLDTCALRYLLGYSTKGFENKFQYDLEKFKADISKTEIITDAMSVFELFNDIKNFEEYFNVMQQFKHAPLIYIKFYKKQTKVHEAFKNARDNGKYSEFFNALTDAFLHDYTPQLSKLIFYFVDQLLHIIYKKYNFSTIQDDKRLELNLKVTEILKPAKAHIEKCIRKKLKNSIQESKFDEDFAQHCFKLVIRKVFFYFNNNFSSQITTKEEFCKKLNNVKDLINQDNFLTPYDGDFPNLQELANGMPTKKINENQTINLYNFKDSEIFCQFLNVTLNKIRRGAKKYKFNDLKDAIIAENYLSNVNENNDKDTIFVTFDEEFIKKLRKIQNTNIKKSLDYIDSLHKWFFTI